ncbi:MAG: signal peptidase II [Verrucomicrobiota bacterium]
MKEVKNSIDDIAPRKTPLWWFWPIVVAVVFLDQLTKSWVLSQFSYGESRVIIPGFFNLTYVRNDGIAFGLFQGNNVLLGVVVVCILSLGVWYSRRFHWEWPEVNVVFGLIVGGAIGNLIDRVRLSYVVDFFDFNLIIYRWPAFNIADACISTTVVWLLIRLLFTKVDFIRNP